MRGCGGRVEEQGTHLVYDTHTDGLAGTLGEGVLEAVSAAGEIRVCGKTFNGRVAVGGAARDGDAEWRWNVERVGDGGRGEGEEREEGVRQHGGLEAAKERRAGRGETSKI